MNSADELPLLSVAEFDRRLKRAVERAAQDVWVEGEVFGAKSAPSGHVYFSLKDGCEDAMIECVMYRSTSVRARQLVRDGARVQLRGHATFWAPRGRLQFIAEQARPSGRGALLEALEALKAKLAAEGLFAIERKRPLPEGARTIGVVTSAAGAAIHDIAKVAFRRGPVRIVLAPALVQGQGAAVTILQALDRLEQLPEIDVIILGRGGGSAEDLMVFNDEVVVRRVAAARVPIVSAVGHEVDVTLTDLAADARAATPSQAAELLVPDEAARRRALEHTSSRLVRAMRARGAEDRATLAFLRAGVAGHRTMLARHAQRVDDLFARLEHVAHRRHARAQGEHDKLERRMLARHPRAVVARARTSLGPLAVRLEAGFRKTLAVARSRVVAAAGRVEAMSPLAVLGRGYAIVTTGAGRAVRAPSEVEVGEPLSIRVHRGTLQARVEPRSAPTAQDVRGELVGEGAQ